MPDIAYIGIGSNLGDKRAACSKAIELLADAGRVVRVSSFYYTEPIGLQEQDDFMNAVIALETGLAPRALLEACNAIEAKLGRTRTRKWGPRAIDLDILLYGSQVVNEPDLVIPHPLMAGRRFVLAPLAEIAPQAVHPVLHKTADLLLRELKDTCTVMKCSPDCTTP